MEIPNFIKLVIARNPVFTGMTKQSLTAKTIVLDYKDCPDCIGIFVHVAPIASGRLAMTIGSI